MIGPLTSIDLFANQERRVLEIMKIAALSLRSENELPFHEDALNRLLYRHVIRATRQVQRMDSYLDWPCIYEANNQPDASDFQRTKRESKRPDFQWGIYDHTEPEIDRSQKFYTAECKRLGSPAPGSAWVFNENYVCNGMFRFIDPTYGYAKSARSGLMIGYLQSMKEDDVLSEINAHAETLSVERIKLDLAGWRVGDVTRLRSLLSRPQVLPTPFNLHHLWVDLRNPPTDPEPEQ